LDDGSRVKRVGEQGKLFNFYKFRTMHPKTHNLRYTELAEQNTRKGTPMVKIKNDPRVTKIGNFLRKTSIDELPQLINVLMGQMSIVGPRPHLPEEVANYEKHHKFVLTIKPGITGLAQISGRSDLDFEKEVRLDSYYIEHWSLWLDIKIIFKTFGAVIKGYKE
jgi:lipopolysaccharide/colanic/teichoic acid biosynthesis glycosyltransferase